MEEPSRIIQQKVMVTTSNSIIVDGVLSFSDDNVLSTLYYHAVSRRKGERDAGTREDDDDI